MKTICFNQRGDTGGGGPVTFVYKTAVELQKRGFKVIYDNCGFACERNLGKRRELFYFFY